MKEYEYTIIRRESRNPKRNRETRGVTQSDIEALKHELAGGQKEVDATISNLNESLSEIDGLTLASEDLRKRLEGAELAISGKLDSGTFDKWRAEDYKRATDRLTTAETAISKKLDSGVFDQWKAGDYSQRQSALDEALKSKQPAGNYALSSELESHKRATDSGFEELAIELDSTKNKLNEGIYEAISKANTSLRELDGVHNDFGLLYQDLTSEKAKITSLQEVALTSEMREDLDYLTNSLQVLRSGDNSLAGLKLQRHIALSGDGVNVSAYIASKPMEAFLKAGITDFGKPTEREEVAICHDGTGHIGNLYFTGNRIDFRTGLDDAPYLSIGNEDNQFIDNFLATARLDDIPVSVGSVTLTPSTPSTTSYERPVAVANDGTRLTVSIGDLNVETYNGATTRLLLDGEVLAEWEGVVDIVDGSGGGVNVKPQTIRKPYTASNLSYERVVKAGRHTLRLEIARPNSNATATIRGLRVRRLYDTGRQQSALTKSGLRLFGSPDRYFDVDYRQTYIDKSGFSYTRADNDYTVRIKGGAKVDKLTTDELDMPGVPLCGASFNENGGQEKAFGKYANKRGMSRAQAEYDYGMAAFKVYHSIGNTNYIPIVQVSGWDSGDINWSLTPRVYNITSEYFVVRILSNNDNPQRKAISYVAYKTQ